MNCSLSQHDDVGALGKFVDNGRGFRIEKFNADLGTNELLIAFFLQDGGRHALKSSKSSSESNAKAATSRTMRLTHKNNEHADRNPAALRVHDFDDVG